MPALTKAEAIDYITASDTGLIEYVDFPRTGKTLQTRIPISVSTLPVSVSEARQCPALGEDNRNVLRSVGYLDTEIDAMAETGAISKA